MTLDHAVEVLSTGFEQLYMTTWQHAISVVFCGRAEIVTAHPTHVIKCVDEVIPMPMSVRFKKGVFAGAIKRPASQKTPTRSNLYIRDAGICQYCEKKLPYDKSTRDHVIPQSRGGKDEWENLVLCCESCNCKKGSKLLSETSLRLRRAPFKPLTNMFHK